MSLTTDRGPRASLLGSVFVWKNAQSQKPWAGRGLSCGGNLIPKVLSLFLEITIHRFPKTYIVNVQSQRQKVEAELSKEYLQSILSVSYKASTNNKIGQEMQGQELR